MALRMVCIDDDGLVRVAADGPITADNFASVNDNPLEALLGSAWSHRRVVLDMTLAQSIDSSAIGWLLNCHKGFLAGGGRIVLHSVHPRVWRILNMLRVDTLVPIVSNESAARIALVKEAA